jgi:hypothetical protein
MPTKKATPKTAAKDVAAKAKADAQAAADEVKDNAADSVDAQAEQIRDAGKAFDDNPYARQAADQISDGLTQMASSLRHADLRSIQTDLTQFARRNPLLFFGGAAAVGFLAARALKASEQAQYEVDHKATPSDRHNYPSVPDAQRAYPDQNKHRWGYS